MLFFWGHTLDREAQSTTLPIRICLNWGIYWVFQIYLALAFTLPATKVYSYNSFWPYIVHSVIWMQLSFFLFVSYIGLAESPLLFSSLWNDLFVCFAIKCCLIAPPCPYCSFSPFLAFPLIFLSLLSSLPFPSLPISFSCHCLISNFSKDSHSIYFTLMKKLIQKYYNIPTLTYNFGISPCNCIIYVPMPYKTV